MDKGEIQRKADELRTLLIKHKSDLGKLEKELFAAIAEYHDALRAEKIREIKASIAKLT